MEQSLHSTWAQGQKEREEQIAAGVQALQLVSVQQQLCTLQQATLCDSMLHSVHNTVNS